MTVAALCAHPAYVARAPRRGTPRPELVEARTPVVLREADRGEFTALGRVDRAVQGGYAFEPYLRRGELWMPLRRMSDDSGRPSDAAVTAGEFAAFLENRLPVRTDLAWMLSGFFDATPLVRRRTPGPWDTVHMPSLRGMPTEGLDDGPLALDERPECAAAVTAFVDREVRLVDGAVFARLHPVVDRAEAFDGPYDRLYVTRAGTFAQPVRKPGAMPPLPVKPGREASPRACALALIDGVALPDDDLVAMANALPGGILPVLAPASDGRGRLLPDALREDCAGARARITALHRLGERGMADRGGLAEAFEAMAQADRLLAEAEGRGFAVRPGARKIRAYLLEAMPRLSPPAPDDAADIAALAP